MTSNLMVGGHLAIVFNQRANAPDDSRYYIVSMNTISTRFGVILVYLVVLACRSSSSAQILKPPEADDSLKVFIEEVRIPVMAKDANGRFDPTVGLGDMMLKENGIVQPLKSVYRVPASVLLVLDTGGELNLAKSVRLTRAVAKEFVSSLQPQDQIAVMQVNDRVELLQQWTTNQEDAVKSLSQLIPAKRSELLSGLLAAVERFDKIAYGNRHLVLISDGIERGGVQPDLSDAFRALIAANISVHVISYASMGMKVPPPEPTRPRVKSAVAPELIIALPHTRLPGDPTPDLKDMMSSKGGMVLDIDLLFRRKGIKAALAGRTAEFFALTDETGGNLALPVSGDEMIAHAVAIAHDVDSQYVLTYKPLQPFNRSKPDEYRLVDVISRRVGLTIRARRGYVAKSAGVN